VIPILLRELKCNRRSVILWALSLGLLILLVLGIYPSFVENGGAAADFERYLEAFPQGFKRVFGMDRLAIFDPVGFFAVEMYVIVTLFGGIFAAMLGAGLLAKEEDEKTVEFLLAKPVTRGAVVTSKVLSMVAGVLLFNLLLAAATLAGFEGFVKEEYNRSALLWLLAAPVLVHLVFGAGGFLISLFFVRRRSAVSGSIAVVLMLYFFDVVAVLSERLRFLEYFSPFRYIRAADIVSAGSLRAEYALGLLAAFAVMVGATYLLYGRRDILV